MYLIKREILDQVVNGYFLLPLRRVWKSLSEVTCCRSLVVVYDGKCILQVGFAAESAEGDGEAERVEAGKLMQGLLYKGVLKSQAREQ